MATTTSNTTTSNNSNNNSTIDSNQRCNIRGCKKPQGVRLLECGAENCCKPVHLVCFHGIILSGRDGATLTPLPDKLVACTKVCYNAIVKAKSGVESNRGKWDCDGKNGPGDPNTSMKILLDWITEEGNYMKFCGKDKNGIKKKQFGDMLALRMRQETSSEHRTSKQVLDKIKRLEEAFRNAHNFATSATGEGIQERQGKETFQDLVRKKCQYYYELGDIMGDRSATQPRITNCNAEDMDYFSDEEEDHDNNDNGKNNSSSEEEDDDVNNATSSRQSHKFRSSSTNDNVSESTVQSPTIIDNIRDVGNNQNKRSSQASSIASSRKSSKSKKQWKASNTPLMDDKTVAMLAVANQSSKEKMEELIRHNREVESFEREKINIERQKMEILSWKGKSDELDYKVKLVSEYNRLKQQGYSNKQIIRLFPEMDSVMNALRDEDDTDSD